MNNQRQGSRTPMVSQNAPIFPDPDTIKLPLTPRQAASTTHFLEMSFAALRGEPVDVRRPKPPPSKHFQQTRRPVPVATPSLLISDQGEDQDAPATLAQIVERKARSKAHHRKPPKATPPAPAAQDGPEGQPAWLLDTLRLLDQQEARERAELSRVFVRQRVQRQPLPRLEELLSLEDFRPKRGRGAGTAGAGALAAGLHELGRIGLATRLYLYDRDGHPPKQIVLHLCAELLAEALGVSENTLRDWTTQLRKAGYLSACPHYTTTTVDGKQVTVVDGMLYAIRLAPDHTARLRYQDYKRAYRNLDADRAAGRTAYNAIANAAKRAEEAQILEGVQDGEKNTEGSCTPTGQIKAELLEQLRRWAVIPGNVTTQNPLKADPAVINPDEAARRLGGVQDVVHALSTLLDIHASKRAALIGIMGAALARDLDDQHSRAYYCKIIWLAWQAELEGRDGLQALGAELQHLEVDRREWKGLRRPAALLAARLRAA